MAIDKGGNKAVFIQGKPSGVRMIVLSFLVLILFTGSAVAQESADELVALLAKNDYRASMKLEAMGLEALPALEKALDDPNYTAHFFVVLVLRRIGLPETIPLFKKALDYDTRVRDAAVEGLLMFKESGVTKTTAELLTDEKDNQELVLTIMRAALKNDYNLVELLTDLFEPLYIGVEHAKQVERTANVAAVLFIENQGEADIFTDMLKSMAVAEEPQIRMLAMNTFFRISEIAVSLGQKDELALQGIIEVLLAAVENPSEVNETQALAASTLSILAPADPRAAANFVKVLTERDALKKSTKADDMQWTAVRALEKYGVLQIDQIQKLLEILPELEAEMRWRLAPVFVESGKADAKIVDKLGDKLAVEKSQDLKFYLVRVIGAIGDKAAGINHLLSDLLVKETEPMIREAILAALSRIN